MTKHFANQGAVRRPWRTYLDSLQAYRADLHRYCRQLAGNVWDGEDLMQDTLMRVFSMLGKIDADIENPRAYLIRTATNLWIDRVRRLARERAALALLQPEASSEPNTGDEQRDAAKLLFQSLHAQERVAILMKDVFDLSLEETATMLSTTVGAVKAALSRARGRLDARKPSAGFDAPPKDIVERFVKALGEKDLEALRALCSDDLTVELVGGAQLDGWTQSKSFFAHAHMSMPALGLGVDPRWTMDVYEGEPLVLGFRSLNAVEGLNEIHRIEAVDGKITRVRCYCFCPETLTTVAQEFGIPPLSRPHRSPTMIEAMLAMVGVKRRR